MIEELVEIAKKDKRVNIDFTINNRIHLFSAMDPKNKKIHTLKTAYTLYIKTFFFGQALVLLVTVSSMHCCTSTSALSTSSSSRGLTSF